MNEKVFSTLNVLVVDDEAFSQRLVQRMLGMLGVTRVTLTDNGVKAMDVLESSDTVFDLIISDIEMPEMDGFELARKIRWGAVAQYKDIPFLMLTGQDTEENIQKGKAYKIQGFIIKPPKREILQIHLEKALGL